MSHTTGELTLRHGDDVGDVDIMDGDARVATVYGGPNAVADAKLFAAAWRLLSAGDKTLEWAGRYGHVGSGLPSAGPWEEVQDAVDVATEPTTIHNRTHETVSSQ